uniref:Neuromedin U n=1 Tax=Pipistrellus kuhlii TaxID=59472 RepID=A0A7J8B3J1_PIPKU|nr:neuromedin U [Pipistrellus kuhlii]
MPPATSRLPRTPPGQGAATPLLPAPPLLLLLLLACWAGAGQGAPILPQGLQPEEELQLWNEIDAACSSFLSIGSQPQASNALAELCFTIMGTLPKAQSSVVHPLLQLVPQLHERRMKRFKSDGEFQGPIASHSRRYFLFRPRNGRRSEGYI